MPFRNLPPELVHSIIANLPQADQSRLSRVNSEMHFIITPILYAEVKLWLTSKVSISDKFISALQSLSYARVCVMVHVRHFEIGGFWYVIYHEVESQLGEKGIVSPTVRLLNILIARIIDRMSNLKSFRWDLQVAPTDVVIEAITKCPRLSEISLRLSTSSPGSPYCFPDVQLTKFSPLRVLALEAINSPSMLGDVAKIVKASENLEVLRITVAYELEGMPLARIFDEVNREKPLRIRVLDLRCFDDLQVQTLWESLDPKALKELTMRCSPSTAEKNELDVDNFWRNMTKAGVQLTTLYTDMIGPAIIQFLLSCREIKDLFLVPRHDTIWGREELGRELIERVAVKFRHSLKRLAIYSRDNGRQPELFDADSKHLKMLGDQCTHLIELGTQIRKESLPGLVKVLHHFKALIAIHIIYSDGQSDEPEHMNLLRELCKVIEKYPELPLRFVALNFEAIYELVRRKNRIDVIARSPKDWVDDPYITLFSQNLWEW